MKVSARAYHCYQLALNTNAINQQIVTHSFSRPARTFTVVRSCIRLSSSIVRTFKLVDDKKIFENNLQSLKN
jgi:hypothetical protein